MDEPRSAQVFWCLAFGAIGAIGWRVGDRLFDLMFVVADEKKDDEKKPPPKGGE